MMDYGRASTEHAVTSRRKQTRLLDSGCLLENQYAGLELTNRGFHVLVVDDNRDAADSLCLLLRLWGYSCRATYDGKAGLKAASETRPDCLLLDIAMPGMDGYTLARRVRAQPFLDNAMLVALTAFSDEKHVHLSQEAGFDYLFVKPIDPLEMKRLMDKLSKVV